MIYVNGDSHSAGADIIPGICFAEDDPKYLAYGRRAHPEAVLKTYGYNVAKTLNSGFFCEAESASSNDRILRTTKNYIQNTKNKNTIGYIIIGWTSWEREEWQNGENFVQVTASGTDSVPEHMAEDYKQWVIKQTPEEYKRKEQLWYNRIWDFHCELKEQNIRHFFFNTTQPLNDNRDWEINFFPISYSDWLKREGFETLENSNHFGIDAHRAWANYIVYVIQRKHVSENTKLPLTIAKRRSIIPKLKEEFRGLRK